MLPRGSLVDSKFEILGPAGAGGMGTVYKARQRELNRIVALKLIAPHDMASDTSQRFKREALAISALKHRNIVSFYGYGIDSQLGAYIAMEYLEGQSLASRINECGCLQLDETMDIIQQVCEGLRCAHRHSVVHRDLKPSNIMLVNDNGVLTVKLVDFGLAKLVEGFSGEVQRLTDAGTAIGTVLYMSPEQCLAHEADCRSDIYSVGAILHHCLSGTPPFAAEHHVLLMEQQVVASPPPLKALPGTDEKTASAAQSIVLMSMQKDPSMRYQSADEVLDDLRALRGRLPLRHAVANISAARPAERTAFPIRKLGLIAVSLLLVIGVAVYKSQIWGSLPFANSKTWQVQMDATEAAIRKGHYEGLPNTLALMFSDPLWSAASDAQHQRLILATEHMVDQLIVFQSEFRTLNDEVVLRLSNRDRAQLCSALHLRLKSNPVSKPHDEIAVLGLLAAITEQKNDLEMVLNRCGSIQPDNQHNTFRVYQYLGQSYLRCTGDKQTAAKCVDLACSALRAGALPKNSKSTQDLLSTSVVARHWTGTITSAQLIQTKCPEFYDTGVAIAEALALEHTGMHQQAVELARKTKVPPKNEMSELLRLCLRKLCRSIESKDQDASWLRTKFHLPLVDA